MNFRPLIATLLAGLFAMPVFSAESTGAPPKTPRKITVRFSLLNIPEIQETTETFVAQCYLQLRWRDPSLAFAGETPQVLLEDAAQDKVKEIWRPEVQFANESAASEVKHTILTIQPDGSVSLDREMEATLASDLDLSSFPFDRQVLQIQLESFGQTVGDLVFETDPRHLVMAKSISPAQWRPGTLRWATSVERDDLTDASYSRVTVSLEVERRPGFYIWQIFVPLLILITIAGTVFFLPPGDLADRMNVIVTSLLTAVALSYAVHGDLPKISYLTVVDWLFVLAYIFLATKIVVMLVVKQLAEPRGELANTINRHARWFFPAAYLSANAAVIAMSILRR